MGEYLMILLSSIIKQFESDLLSEYKDQILPSHRKALSDMAICRTSLSPKMQVDCLACDHKTTLPHSCGHRNCPHCQAHEGQRWLERQLKKQVPAEYYLLTFTLPSEFRSLAWRHQKIIYSLMIKCCWETLYQLSQNDKALMGTPGAIAVLHTHKRNLGYHPHVHIVMPAAAIDLIKRLWRTKSKNKKRKSYLFNQDALAIVFRAKLLDAITKSGLTLPAKYPKEWVVHCQTVGSGEKALTYLGKYLYRGVIQEKDIISCENGAITFRYVEGKNKIVKYRKVAAVKFLWLIMQHVLPKGFRRARNFGFLHPNSKRLIQLLQYFCKFDPARLLVSSKRPSLKCCCCGALMVIVKTRIYPGYSDKTVKST
jgi:hypothetical protein